MLCNVFYVQALENELAKEVAKKERERLKNQDKMKREQVEKLRQQLNTDAAAGEVRKHGRFCCLDCHSL